MKSGVESRPKDECAGVIVLVAHNKALLVRGNGGRWGFPKGHLEGEETALQAAVRELREEVGVEARADSLRGPVDEVYEHRSGRHGTLVEKTVHYYCLELREEPTVRLQEEELSEYMWATEREASTRLNASRLAVLRKIFGE